ncbi:hypothetical protein LTR99_007344 [Exophiala xenobiotica]|uniref:Uncharacterized protein n=1 Tax=Vermiconidia calcicola TaxID=1690605 RepID=A0AAV9Q3F3_9PEZI|nr:hypothetical protein LTR96_007982 [Exophiala xenobiotica]KAK5534453.1 hypothetical protein LTR25_006485 [Vermiconidia calcicola]KAK5544665.1 hypothetical protein LTR23_004429 [Chaetothyriales sp. CCFEE 6169]KAK5299076.1 hypothetical protein LTR99_007344 [Exophiala xenobiotica]KAK5334763.1 hypothetical protein LTR98_009136 [Exophiala xenobiotica]
MTTMEAASAQEDASALSDQDLPDDEDSDVTEYFRPDEEYTSDRPSTPPNFVQYCHHCYQSLLHMSAQGKSKHRKRCEKSFEGGKRRPGAEKAKKTGICPHCNTDISALAEPAGHRFRCKKRNEAKTQKDQGETVICTYCSKDITELNNPDAHRSRCRDQRATQALGTPKHRLVQPDDIEAAAEFSTVNRFQDDSSSSNELGTSRDDESGEADNSGGESAGAKEIRHGKRLGFDTLTHRQKGHDKQIGASDTWKATQKAELERERANNRFVASTFTNNKEALRLREEKLYRQKAEFAEAMYKQENEFAEAIYKQETDFVEAMYGQEAALVEGTYQQIAEFAEAKALLKRQQKDLARREARVAEREAEMAEKGAQVAEKEAQVAERETRVGELINSLVIWHEHFGQQFDALRAQSTPSAVPTIMTTPAHPPLGTSPAQQQKSRIPRQVPRPKTSHIGTAASPDRRAAT